MFEELEPFLRMLQGNSDIHGFDEIRTKQGIILPILQHLGWKVFDIDEVTPEYPVDGLRLDYCLSLNKRKKVFIEVKKPSESLENHLEQLVIYATRNKIEIAFLTNGISWWGFLPMVKEVEWGESKFYSIDIVAQPTTDTAQKFIDFLSKDNISSGRAIHTAESHLKSKLRKQNVEQTMPLAWEELLAPPDELIVEILAETTEKLCGFKPTYEEVERFFERRAVPSPREEQSKARGKAQTIKRGERAASSDAGIRHYDVEVSELFDSGILRAPCKIIYEQKRKGIRAEGTLERNGSVLLKGRKYESIAKALRSVSSTNLNAWLMWKSPDNDGRVKSLTYFREQYLKQAQ